MRLFGGREKDPAQQCPQCGGPKSATMRLCNSCIMKAKQAERGGQYGAKDAPQAGQRGWAPSTAPPPPPPPPPPGSAGSPPAAPPGGSLAPPPSGSLDAYALSERNYPYRSKQGVWVRTAQELEVANFLYEHFVVFAYEPTLTRFRPAFVIPEKSVVIDRIGGWDAAERKAGMEGLGFKVVPLPERDVRSAIEQALAPYFFGKK